MKNLENAIKNVKDSVVIVGEAIKERVYPEYKVDVKKTEIMATLTAKTPGVSKERIHVSYVDNTLLLKIDGEKEFKREFLFDGYDMSTINIDYTNGLLTITVDADIQEIPESEKPIEINF